MFIGFRSFERSAALATLSSCRHRPVGPILSEQVGLLSTCSAHQSSGLKRDRPPDVLSSDPIAPRLPRRAPRPDTVNKPPDFPTESIKRSDQKKKKEKKSRRPPTDRSPTTSRQRDDKAAVTVRRPRGRVPVDEASIKKRKRAQTVRCWTRYFTGTCLKDTLGPRDQHAWAPFERRSTAPSDAVSCTRG